MANIQLAKNLLYLRTLYNLKQDDIANLFNITRQACSNYEKSTRTPDLDVLASFAAYFHVTLDQLILHDLKAEGFTADSDSFFCYDGVKNSIYAGYRKKYR